jgi:hypothetical protein
VKITIDPMLALRQAAEDKIEGIFNVEASLNIHRDQEHAAKRQAAKAQLNGEKSDHLEAEAKMTGTRADDLARVILSKPNNVLERGLRRRQALVAVRTANSPAEIDRVLKELGAKI